MTERLEWVRAVVHEYEGALTLYTTKFLRDRDRARDVVQEAFLKLCKQDRKAVEPRVKPWLFTVCRNRALDIRRKEKSMFQLNGETAMQRESAEPAPSEALERQESVSRVLVLVDALPERQQEAIRLKFQHGHSYREISDVMNTNVGNVGVLIHTGLKALRQKMASDGA